MCRTLSSLLLGLALLSCSSKNEGQESEEERSEAGAPTVDELEDISEAAADEAASAAMAAALDREYPLHGLVLRPALTIRASADPESAVIGWLRSGERIRLKADPTTTSTCASGWYELAPRGFACAGEGIEVGESPPANAEVAPPAQRDQTMPYTYYFVKEPMVAQFFQLPSRDQQRAAQSYAQRYLELLASNERRAERMLSGEIPSEPQRHPAIDRFLHHGFYIAGSEVQVRSRRRFVRTTDGGFVKEAQLEERTGSDFHGVEISEERPLPVAWTLRTAHLRTRETREDGSDRMPVDDTITPIERQEIVEGWQERLRIGDHFYHRIHREEWDQDRYVRDWFVGVAEQIEPPFSLEEEDEPWIHIDLSSQTLVIYRGQTPVYATLVSTGLDDFATPTGTFRIHKKSVTDTMANLGPDAGDDSYRIQDVPWTQYFEGSFAIHTAFWHHRFGLQRSHGCVNLAPVDAHRVFQETWPRVPSGWHGVNARDTGFRASRIHITE